MKKILTLLTVAAASLLAFTAIGIIDNAKSVNAQEEDKYQISILSNYNVGNIFDIQIDKDDPDGPEAIYELPFEKSYEKVNSISISVYSGNLPEDYVEFKIIHINDAEESLDYNSETGVYFKEFNNIEEGLTEIVLDFELAKFELNTGYKQDDYNNIEGVNAGSSVNYFKLNAFGQKERIEAEPDGKYYINYSETLIIEPQNKITVSGKSYGFKALYFNIPDPGNLVNEDSYVIEAKLDEAEEDRFLDKYIVYESTTIYFIAVYTKDYTLSLTFGNPNYAVNYEVFIVNNDNTLTKSTAGEFFEKNTKLRIVMSLKDYTRLSKLSDGRYDIKNLSPADIVNEKDGSVTIDFELTKDKTFEINLNLITFEVKDISQDLGEVNIDFSEPTFVYNDKIRVISSIAQGMNEIKIWKINGIEVPKIGETDAASGMKRIDVSTVEIDTAVWYEKFGINFNSFNNEITTGMKTSILLAITLPTGIAVLAVLILLFVILQNILTKKKIRALLEEERQMELKFNSMSMADQLREGKSFTITDEDVKAEMKKRKIKTTEEEENKPAEPKN